MRAKRATQEYFAPLGYSRSVDMPPASRESVPPYHVDIGNENDERAHSQFVESVRQMAERMAEQIVHRSQSDTDNVRAYSGQGGTEWQKYMAQVQALISDQKSRTAAEHIPAGTPSTTKRHK